MATIRDVAVMAGVSTATVSHVVNETRVVSEPLRQKVAAAMLALDYQPDAVARSLRRRETLTLGLMVPSVEIPFFARVAKHMEHAAKAAGYSIILCNSDWSLERELIYLDNLLARRVDGLVCISLAMRSEHLTPLLKTGTPIVWFERNIPHAEIDAVYLDNHKGAYAATSHLIELGHRRIGCITGLPTSKLHHDRIAGYRQALTEHGLPFDRELLRVGNYTPASGQQAAADFLALTRPPSAIFAFNDLMAMGVLQTLQSRGLRVPDDVAVIGFDGVTLCEHLCPPLSTVEQPVPAMSRRAMELLMDRINGTAPPEARIVVLPPQLIVRASTVGYASTAAEPHASYRRTEDVYV
ncbi:MAG: LacI family DNA-binding transcriptional regulator [Herpetosiphonaceae bacterium]|nr:LacI family DNA-binding transcriptional regulator [Herpetosiphonaceae bacterium]